MKHLFKLSGLIGAAALLAACASTGVNVGVNVPIGGNVGVGVSVGGDGRVTGSVGVNAGGVSVGASGQLPRPAARPASAASAPRP